MKTASSVAKEAGRAPSVVYDHMKRLGIAGTRPQGVRKGSPIVLTDDEAAILLESLKEARSYPSRGRSGKPTKPAPPLVASLLTNGATWQEFQACARKLAMLCRHFRITLLEIDTPADGQQVVKYEQNNSGEIPL